ncbi:MAG: tyrosine-protein phosphatase [Crocinitomicaceae bacterium]
MPSKSSRSILKMHPNFRDLGGFSTKSGKTIQKNIAFRSGFLGELDQQELHQITALNIDRIVDLRTKEEIDLTGQGTYPPSIEYTIIPLNAGNISKFLIPVFQQGAFDLIEPSLLEKVYFELITQFTSELATIFRIILEPDKTIVFHCSHGKDRTGIISALLLDFLEVDRNDIYSDYLSSNEHLKASNESQMQRIKQHFEQLFKRKVSESEFAPVESLFYCRKELLTILFTHIDEEYGSVRNYFQSALGLNTDELKSLRTKYLGGNA